MYTKARISLYILICIIFNFNLINAKEIQSRIIGGNKLESIQGKEYLVSLMTKNNGFYNSSCGGTLISPKYVITAAHCIVNKDMYVFANYHILPDTQQAKSGADGTTATQVIGNVSLVERVFYYSDYMETNNDIAVLRLETAISIPQYASLPTIGQTKSLISKNTKLSVSGWGLTSSIPSGGVAVGDIPEGAIVSGEIPEGAVPQEAGFLPPRDLHTVYTSTLSEAQCKTETTQGKEPTTPSQIATRLDDEVRNLVCAGGQVVNEVNQGICQGDSGGPLMYEDGNNITLIGVSSRGVGICTGIISAKYTKVESFLSFIDEAKKGTFLSDGILRKGYMQDLPQGWSLIGTESKLDKNTKFFTNDIKYVYHYSSGSRKWVEFSLTNGTPSNDFNIPAKSGFWIYKP